MAEVSREMTQWPNGYSDEERIAWHAAEAEARRDEAQRGADRLAGDLPKGEGEAQ